MKGEEKDMDVQKEDQFLSSPFSDQLRESQPPTINLIVTKINSSFFKYFTQNVQVNVTDCPLSLLNDNRISNCVKNGYQSPRNFKIIFNGRVLSPALSFAFQGVTNNSEVFIMCPENPEANNNRLNSPHIRIIDHNLKSESAVNRLRQRFNKKWKNKINDPDFIFDQIKDSIDPITANESARISDIKRMRIEENSLLYQKVCSRFNRIESNSYNLFYNEFLKKSAPTVIPARKLEPSNCPLPELHEMKCNNGDEVLLMTVPQSNSCRDRFILDSLF